ncbi:ABC-2 type transporter-domain-containing protein [Aspergillus caelatus]|uniref:ABC-2 type transporter-domain-containing protein n=1 Tax=Aspergillus caelatus TaxID=61420 RepID=A0A5N7ADM1_9EURO|nr:ABC-2 type transporter-domain-containing protein [Aspergillus caelatus]KAE8367266.1 ABC-2 type transporter-domain-containing protein [Aspergillus caelatus]
MSTSDPKDETSPVPKDLPIYRQKGRGLGVAFRNITVQGRSGSQRTVLDLPQILFEVIKAPYQTVRHRIGNKPVPKRNLIQDVSGVLFPGETMIVLGRPGSGCTTLLKVIANNRNSFMAVNGDVQYAGIPARDMTGALKSEIIYSSEDDLHFPTLPVKDTLDFALKLRRPKDYPMEDGQFSSDYTKRLLGSLGMLHTSNTIVGDSFTRGVSGGERRRVSLAESMAVNPALACWDNPIRGLDSSSALDFLALLKEMSGVTGMNNVVTLYQASEAMYRNCFDRVILMYDGLMIFSGKAGEAKQYFHDLGFHCADRQTTPDFLTSITSPAERTIREGYSGPLYLEAKSLEQAFRQSPYYTRLQAELTQYSDQIQSNTEVQRQFRQSALEIRSKMTTKRAVEISSLWKQVTEGTQRYYRLFWGDRNTFYTILALCIVNAVITGSGFYAAPKTASGSFERSGALFFALAYFCLNALTEVVKTVNARSILLKQHNLGLISPTAYAIIQTVADIPIAFIQTAVFSCCYYFIIGLSESASQFFIFLLLVFVHYCAIGSMFRMLGSWAPSLSISHLLAGCALPVACLYSGYAPPVPTMHRWGSWIRRISPTPYAMEALMGNEFYNIDLHCTDSQLIPSGPEYDDIRYQACPMAGAHQGSALVNGATYAQAMYGFSREHLWRNFGIVLVMWFLYTVIGAVGLTVMTRDSSSAAGHVYKRNAQYPQDEQLNVGLVSDVEKQPISPTARDDGWKRNEASTSELTITDVDEAVQADQKEDLSPRSVTFTFNKLSYYVNVGGGEKQLLCEISGYVKPGQLTALMGASGAGKTTLLDNLSRRKTDGRVEGEILLNGAPLSTSFSRSCGFCMQQDIHEPTATVREALQFSAYLRQPAHISKEEKMQYVEHVIALLELEGIADALIGAVGDGQLNVEERKRVTIGVELAAKPSALLFLDEPTSGLDSQAAYSIVSFLRRIAAEGIPIVCTIHQPSGVLFEMFDHVILLAPGGRTVYFGETGKNASAVAAYFARHGAVMHAEENPAEFIISTIAAKGDDNKDWPEIWNRSPECHALHQAVQALNQRSPVSDNAMTAVNERPYALSLPAQIVALTQRHWIAIWRNGQYNFSRLFKSIFFQMFVSFTFFHVNKSSPGLKNHMLGILLSTWVVPTISADMQAIWYEKWSIFEARERNGIYDYKALLSALFLVEIPCQIIIFTFIFIVSYWTFGFASTPSIAGFIYFMYLLFAFFGLGFTYLMAALFPNPTMAGYAMSLFWVILLMFSGAANPRSGLNDFYRPWLFWADPMTYFFEPTVSTVLHGIQAQCAPQDMAVFDPPSGQSCMDYVAAYLDGNPGYLANPNATQNCNFCPYSTGDDLARSLHFFYGSRWRDWAVFLGFGLTNTLLTFLATWIIRVKIRQWRK